MKRTRIALALAAIASLLTTAHAGTTGAVLGTVEVRDSADFTDGNITVWGGGFSSQAGKGGIYIIEASNTTGDANHLVRRPDNRINAFCMELPQAPSNSWRDYEVWPVSDASNPGQHVPGSEVGTSKAGYLAELWGRYYDDALLSGSNAEAFSAAVWEIIYEALPSTSSNWDVTVWNETASSFKASNVDTALANQWLHSLDGTGPKADLVSLTNSSHQDFLVEVPEPTSLALIGVGGLALLRRRRA